MMCYRYDYSAGASVYVSIVDNTWVNLGNNLVGFKDEDFSDANYTAQGVFLCFRVKFDQQTVREAADLFNR